MSWKKNILGDTMDLTPRLNQVETRANTMKTDVDNLVPRIDAIKDLENINRETVMLNEGTKLIDSIVGSSLDVEVTGRTLVSLANSNLSRDKYYVLSDKNTKVIVDGKTNAGIGKFKLDAGNDSPRGSVLRVENFEGKIGDSTVGNPHFVGRFGGRIGISGLLDAGVSMVQDVPTDRIATIGGGVYSNARPEEFNTPQTQFGFNIIEAVERNIGKIPRILKEDKISWLKSNVQEINFKWLGFGEHSDGYGARIRCYDPIYKTWVGTDTESRYNQTKDIRTLVLSTAYWGHPMGVSTIIDSNGYVYYVAYAEPSTATRPSIIHTDYVDVEIVMKPNADFYSPIVPLYEISKEEYDKVLVSWNESEVERRYPRVTAYGSVKNVVLKSSSGNLVDLEKVLKGRAISGSGQLVGGVPSSTLYMIPVVENTKYYINEGYTSSNTRRVYHDHTGKVISDESPSMGVFTTPPRCCYMSTTISSDVNIDNLIISIYSEYSTSMKSDYSTLSAEVILRGINDKKDRLFNNDGSWKLINNIGYLELSGSLSWRSPVDYPDTNHKRFQAIISGGVNDSELVTDFRGRKLNQGYSAVLSDGYSSRYSDGNIYIGVSNTETGFTSAQIPTSEDIKRYFNGWKYSDGTTWTSVTGNGQTATAQISLSTKPTDYTPYKLSYVLAVPLSSNVNDIVKGNLSSIGKSHLTITNDGVSIIDSKATYAKNIGSSLNDIVSRVEDNITSNSVQSKLIIDILARAKAGQI